MLSESVCGEIDYIYGYISSCLHSFFSVVFFFFLLLTLFSRKLYIIIFFLVTNRVD